MRLDAVALAGVLALGAVDCDGGSRPDPNKASCTLDVSKRDYTTVRCQGLEQNGYRVRARHQCPSTGTWFYGHWSYTNGTPSTADSSVGCGQWPVNRTYVLDWAAT